MLIRNTLPETNSSPLKMMVSNRNLQTSRGLFSWDMLVSGRVKLRIPTCTQLNKGTLSKRPRIQQVHCQNELCEKFPNSSITDQWGDCIFTYICQLGSDFLKDSSYLVNDFYLVVEPTPTHLRKKQSHYGSMGLAYLPIHEWLIFMVFM